MKSPEQRIEACIKKVAELEDLVPAILIVHNIQNGFTVEYMSRRGRQILKTSLEELKAMGHEYYKRFFNEEDAKDYVPKMYDLLARNDMDEVFTFFQQVRPDHNHDWDWYLSSTKIILQDDDNKPLLSLTHAVPIDPHKHLTQKVERLLEENTYMRKNYGKYALLTRREKEILSGLAQAKSNKELADELFISVQTVETHKKNIKSKLNITSGTDLIFFARAFELI